MNLTKIIGISLDEDVLPLFRGDIKPAIRGLLQRLADRVNGESVAASRDQIGDLPDEFFALLAFIGDALDLRDFPWRFIAREINRSVCFAFRGQLPLIDIACERAASSSLTNRFGSTEFLRLL